MYKYLKLSKPLQGPEKRGNKAKAGGIFKVWILLNAISATLWGNIFLCRRQKEPLPSPPHFQLRGGTGRNEPTIVSYSLT